MARVYRVNGYVVDKHDIISRDDIERVLNAKAKEDSPIVGHINIDESAKFDWDDSLKVAKRDCDPIDLADCVDGNNVWNCIEHEGYPVVVGKYYRHFKGMIVKVLAIARDTEDGHLSVVYECHTGVWSRPYTMFISKVDRTKYPDADQEYRFEPVIKE